MTDEEWKALSPDRKFLALVDMVMDDMVRILSIPIDKASKQEMAAKFEVIRLFLSATGKH